MPSFAYLDSVWDSSGKSGCVTMTDLDRPRKDGPNKVKTDYMNNEFSTPSVPEFGEKNFRGVYPPEFPDPKRRPRGSESISPEDRPRGRIAGKMYHHREPVRKRDVVDTDVDAIEEEGESILVSLKHPKLVAMLSPYKEKHRAKIIEEILLESLESTSWTDILKNKSESFLGGLRGNKKKTQEFLFYTWIAIAFVLFMILSGS